MSQRKVTDSPVNKVDQFGSMVSMASRKPTEGLNDKYVDKNTQKRVVLTLYRWQRCISKDCVITLTKSTVEEHIQIWNKTFFQANWIGRIKHKISSDRSRDLKRESHWWTYRKPVTQIGKCVPSSHPDAFCRWKKNQDLWRKKEETHFILLELVFSSFPFTQSLPNLSGCSHWTLFEKFQESKIVILISGILTVMVMQIKTLEIHFRYLI